MSKEILLNGVKTKITKITLDDMVLYIETNHPEDKKKFAELVFNKQTKKYNHFKARNVFLNLYFPDAIEKEDKMSASDEIKSWLEEPSIDK